MKEIDKRFFHRYNLYLEVAFLSAFQQWKNEPTISFARILKDTLIQSNVWPQKEFSREQAMNYILRYIQVSSMMQLICYSYEIVKDGGLDQSAQALKNKLKSIKAKVDVDGKEKATNALQLLKTIREAFAHNDDSKPISNWRLDEEFNVHIESQIDKSGNRHNIKLSFKEMNDFKQVCLENVLEVENCVTELFVNGNKLKEKFEKNKYLSPEQLRKHIRQFNNETDKQENCSERQLQALSCCFNNEFFSGDLVKRLSSPFRPNFISFIYPFEFNCSNHISDINLLNKGLYHLNTNYKSLEDWFSSIFNSVKNSDSMTQESMTYLFYFFSSGKMDSVIISNLLFSIFSFENFEKVKTLFEDTGYEINRIRNSAMHGRFYYNYNKGYDFYDGRSNDKLEYIGTLKISKIVAVAQQLMGNYIEEVKAETV